MRAPSVSFSFPRGVVDARAVRAVTATAVVAAVLVTAASSARAQDATEASSSTTPPAAPHATTGAPETASADRFADLVSVEGGLHADEVARAVRTTSPDLAARRRDVDIARAELDRIWLQYVPRVSLGASYVRLSDIEAPSAGVIAAPADQTQMGLLPSGTPLVGVAFQFPVILDQVQARAQLAIPVSDYLLRVHPGEEAARDAIEATDAAAEIAGRGLDLEARLLYLQWVRVRLSARLADEALERARSHTEDARRLIAAGLGIELDLARTTAQVGALEADRAALAHLDTMIRDRLRTLMHAASIPDAIGDALPEPTARAFDLDALVDDALERLPETRALAHEERAVRHQLDVARAGYWPRLDLVAEALLANPNPRFVPNQARFDVTWAVGAQLNFVVNDALATEPSMRALEARVAAIEERSRSLRDGVRARIADAIRQHDDAAASYEARTSSLRAAELTYRLASQAYRAGRGTSLELVDAQTLATRARLDLLTTRIDGASAEARLANALGL